MGYTAVIVDDELKAASLIQDYLKDFFSDEITETYIAQTVLDAVNLIRKHKPKIVFLDIVLRGGTGFDIVEMLKDQDLNIIFFSAHNQYAIKAFRVSAVDYLLKPVDIDVFKEAVNRVLNKEAEKSDYTPLITNIKAGRPIVIGLASADQIRYVDISDIIRFESDGRYTDVYLSDSTKEKVSKGLIHYDELLNENDFFRTTRSHLINISYVDRFLKSNGGEIMLKDGSIVPIARNKKEAFFSAIDHMRS